MSGENIVVVMMDDMRADMWDYGFDLRNLPGIRRFMMARQNVSLCQASRIGFFSGQLAKTTGALGNGDGQTGTYDHDNQIAAWIQAEGYRTGLIGKYLNLSTVVQPKPDGWDTWREIQESGGYGNFGYTVNDGSSTSTPAIPQYEWLAQEAAAFLAGSEPFFLVVAPKSGHAPFQSHPDDLFRWLDLHWPVELYEDVSAKPSWIQGLNEMTEEKQGQFRLLARQQAREMTGLARTLRASFEAFPSVMANTDCFFFSDNGLGMGEHNMQNVGNCKNDFYYYSIDVALGCIGPDFTKGVTDNVPIYAGHDVNATCLQIAGADAGLPDQAGISLIDIQNNPENYDERQLLHQRDGGLGAVNPNTTDGDAISTNQYKLMRHGTTDPDKYELYDLVNDPGELVNRAYDGGSWLTLRNSLESDLDDLLA